ncbi:MAG: transposase, partial [Verrucomicrobia bacterium]|nr:transposase [Verrucomicrobiota bacterium]
MARKRARRHTPEQIISKLRDADVDLANGATVGEVCQKLEVRKQTYYRWRSQYGGMKAEEARRLRELEQENARLKKIVAEQALDISMLGGSTRETS